MENLKKIITRFFENFWSILPQVLSVITAVIILKIEWTKLKNALKSE